MLILAHHLDITWSAHTLPYRCVRELTASLGGQGCLFPGLEPMYAAVTDRSQQFSVKFLEILGNLVDIKSVA